MTSLGDLLTHKIPPHDLGAERAVIGACILEPSAMVPLLPAEFYAEKHRKIWVAMLELLEKDGTFDSVTIAGQLQSTGDLEGAGGPAHLGQCIEEALIVSSVKGVARMIREKSNERELIKLGTEMIGSVYEGKRLSELDVIQRLEGLPGSLSTAIYDPAVNWHRIVERWGKSLIKTGWDGLDKVLLGFDLGELVVIAGRPSHGKTAFGLALMRKVAGAGTTVDYLALEESDDVATRRLISGVSGVDNYRLKIGNISPAEFADAELAVKALQELPLNVTGLDTMRNLDEDTVVGMAARALGKVVIIDHAQKVNTKGESRTYGLERFLNRLHAIGIRQQKVIIVLWQLNRRMEQEERPPRLSDLRDSGGAEQAARQVLLLYWPWKVKPEEHDALSYQIAVAKNSDGGTGNVTMAYDAKCGRFEDEPSYVTTPVQTGGAE